MKRAIQVRNIFLANAKRWWWFRELRNRGTTASIAEANRLERKAVRDAIRMMQKCQRNGGYVKVAVTGSVSVTYDCGCHLSGGDRHYVDAARIMGIPIIDASAVRDDTTVGQIISLPMVAVGCEPDPAPYRSMSFAPLSYVANEYRKLGARVENVPITE